jgi:hypothetical protein
MNATPDRRTMLRGFGALTTGVAAIPAMAATAEPPDPIFGVIEALKAAEAGINDLRDMGDHAAYEKATDAADAAFDALTATPPATRSGMRALLEFLDEWCGGNNGDYYDYTFLLRSPVLAV